ncbi:MAG: hypothetical protein IJI60_03750 [Bacilli bacterium]|nr:hypothetical protein [Bacilli bacterium]
MKKCSKRIIGLSFFVTLLVLCMISPFSVRAESSQCDNTKDHLVNAYGITVAPEESKFNISMKIDSQYLTSIPGLRQNKTTFKVSRILITKLLDKSVRYSEYVENTDKLAQDLIADYATEADLQSAFGLGSKILADGGSISFTNYQTGDVQYYVVLESTGFDPILQRNCGVDAVSTVVLSFESYARFVPEDPEIIVVDPPTRKTGKIECSGYATRYSQGSFEYNYCRDWDLAERKSDTRRFTFGKGETYYQRYGENAAEAFSCNAWAALEYIKANGLPQSDEDYYTEVNRKYMIGVSSYTDKLDSLRYAYNTGGQNSSGVGNRVIYEDIYCKRTCTEIVTVEYGLPVASKAGMCFEYKVKVTSRVNCDAEVQNIPKPPSPCEPYPFCRSLTSSWTNDDAGPSVEFDSCIASCDGGKYTSNCSRKCYNEVYGVNTALEKDRMPNFSEVVEKLNVYRNAGCDFQGKYYAHGSYVYWTPASCLARYYSHSGRANACVKTEGGGGFSAECDCQMVCQWQGCSDAYYLNPGEKENDATKNQKIYERALEECEKEVECMTTTAEFTISVDYTYRDKDKGVTTTTINFPYTDNSSGSFDSIHYENGQFACTKDQANSTIISSMGCYACGQISNQGEYQTEWGFPGTWINKKTGVLSYKPIVGSQEENWTKRKKFCLPFDAENVNQKWWNSYFEIVDVSGNYSYQDSNYVNNIEGCGGLTECQTTSTFTQTDSVRENIHARARKFGYFGWNIDINCFYALNDSFPSYETYTCDSSESCDGPYVIRSVDLKKMFPSNKADENASRSPGYNWSSYAKIPNEKGTNYSTVDFSADPYEYALWLQQNNYTIYSDENLDYYVKLDKAMLKKLKSSDRDYTKFDGKVEVDQNNVVMNYQSPLFRGGDALLSTSVYPNIAVLRCNNIDKHTKASNYDAQCFVVQSTDLKESGTNE